MNKAELIKARIRRVKRVRDTWEAKLITDDDVITMLSGSIMVGSARVTINDSYLFHDGRWEFPTSWNISREEQQ